MCFECEMLYGLVVCLDIGGVGRIEVLNVDRGDDVENIVVKLGNFIVNFKYVSRCY